VSQVLNRITYCATLSHTPHIHEYRQKSNKLIQPRKLHGTQWGILSGWSEGAQCGIREEYVDRCTRDGGDGYSRTIERIMLNSIDVDSRAKIPDGGNLVMLNYVVGSTR
jgi:DNA-directed RNA polymerase beta subunit